MTHEFKQMIQAFTIARSKGLKTVMASVVALDGSSYRKPGVRMLIDEKGNNTGAISGGCVEKEVFRQSATVFKTGIPKIITYDGRYRLGCDGLLYILIESFDPGTEMLQNFEDAIKNRNSFKIHSYFSSKEGGESWGSEADFGCEKRFCLSGGNKSKPDKKTHNEVFSQIFKPALQLIVIGAEHDAIPLCSYASSLGWETKVVTHLSDLEAKTNFRGADEIIYTEPDIFNTDITDPNTAVVLMTHNYNKDLQFLLKLKDKSLMYLGILGAVKRKDRLLYELMEMDPLTKDSFFESIYAPAGINIGAISPQEIAISICAEILAVHRKQNPEHLRNRSGTIHREFKV